ncbi:MAG: polyphosphate polymerase domain-containing protein [Bdellovibrionales bacterium]|nr:polyphosphate polymerase domain-containing protein [Bdellovibrionales bacterium]
MTTQKRHERKFVPQNYPPPLLEHLIRTHPAEFREIYAERRVNNIYFDTQRTQLYRDSIEGNSQRLKIRLRWYGDLIGVVHSPQLEFKWKENHTVWKETFPLESLSIQPHCNVSTIAQNCRSQLPFGEHRELLHGIQPTLVNSYLRKYFLSSNKLFRITIDRELLFIPLRSFFPTFLNKYLDRLTPILEIKYSQDDEEQVASLTNAFPFRLTRHSKYTRGLDEGYW